MFPLMSTEGVLGAAWLPTDGYIDPAQLTYALADGARRGGCRVFTSTRVDGDRRRRRAGARRAHRARRRSRPRWWSTRAACTQPRSAAWRAFGCPVIPMSHQYLVTQPFRERGERPPADAARPRPARLLPRGRRGPGDGRLRAPELAGVPARRDRRPRPHPARLQRPAARGRSGPLRGDRRELEAAGAGDGRGEDHEADQRPGGVHPRQRVLPRRDRGRRALRRRRLLRPRAGRRRGDRQGDGRVDRRGRAQPRPLGDGRPSLRRPVPLARPTPTPGSRRPTRPTTTSATRTTSAARGGRCASLPQPPGIASTRRRSARSRVGSGSTGTSRTPRGRRVAAPAGLGRPALVRRRSAPSTRPRGRAWRSSTRPRSRRWRSRGPGRPSSSSACATTGWPASRRRSPTRRCSTAAAGSSATSPSRASPRIASRSSPARPSATTIASGSAATFPRTAACRSTTRPRSGPASGSGGRGRATCCSR